MCQTTKMNPDVLLQAISDNPITAGLIVTALGAVAAFFKPIMARVQAALIRRIDQAWQDHEGEQDEDERVRKTAERVRTSTRFPLPQAYVESQVRSRSVSDRPKPGDPL